MRKYLYLITQHSSDALVGKIEATDSPQPGASKNEEIVYPVRNIESGEVSGEKGLVSLGFADFESEEEYEQSWPEVAKEKLREIDQSHLEKAGLSPEEITQ